MYVEVVVLLACVHAQVVAMADAAEPARVPRRTVRRWLTWWRTAFVASALWTELRARLVPPPDAEALPWSLVARLEADSWLLSMARLLAPLTTASAPDGSRLLRPVM